MHATHTHTCDDKVLCAFESPITILNPETLANVEAMAAEASSTSPNLPTKAIEITQGARYETMFTTTGHAILH
jgi:hypothetical protein